MIELAWCLPNQAKLPKNIKENVSTTLHLPLICVYMIITWSKSRRNNKKGAL